MLPVIHSLPSPEAVAGEIRSGYALPELQECRLWGAGVNDVYRVRAGGERYFWKLYRRGWRTLPEVGYEVDLLEHVHRRGVPVALPVAGRDGEVVRALACPEGERAAVLFREAAGKPFSWPYYRDAGDLRRFGSALALLHTVGADFASPHPRVPLDETSLLDRPLSVLEPFLADRPADREYLVGLGSRLRAQLQTLAGGLTWGICHGDYQCGNAFLSADGTVILFDFDACGPGWLAYDLATVRPAVQDEEVWTAFLEGYRERRSPVEADLLAIPILGALRSLHLMSIKVTGVMNGWWDSWWLDLFLADACQQLRDWDTSHLSQE